MAEVLFQLIDADYFMNGVSPVVRLFGRKADGKAVMILINGFEPYFYVKGDIKRIYSEMGEDKKIKDLIEVEKYLPIGFDSKKTKLIKAICYSPKDVRELREKYESSFMTYESDILFKYRFLVDNKIHGMDWLSVNGNKIYSQARLEAYETEQGKINVVNRIENAQLKYMSFDIECLVEDLSRFMDSKQDPIITISFAFSHMFRGKKSLVLCAKHAKADGVPLKCFPDEKTMLEEFLRVVAEYDPDIITGYNINGFDIPFVLDRLKINGLPAALGRTPEASYVRSFGPNNESVVSGRVVVDPFQILKKDVYIRLPRYDLGTVAKEMLNDNKLEMKHRDMGKHWSTDDGTTKIIRYCAKDSQLALDLLLKKRLLDKFFELSKVSGVLLQDSLGGQSTRIEVRVLHEFRANDYVLPPKPNDAAVSKRMIEREKKGLKGATVLEPQKGLHTKGCTLILDFKSLYPSLIITYNLSPDTLINKDTPLAESEKHKSPLNDEFVNETVHKGIFPRILTELMEARGRAKKGMSTANDEERAILDARQAALKILLNSFYGYTGYIKARLYVMEVAGAITSYGRDNLMKTKQLVEDQFKLNLIYGDTDSIFVSTTLDNLDEARKLGDAVSKYITDNLPGVLELQFEKIYRTFLILTKKRYAGWSFSPSFKEGSMIWKDKIETKGIETVRRDWCPLVSETLSTVIEIILKEGDIKKSVTYVKGVIDSVRANKVAPEKLVVVKGITKSIGAYKGIQPHIELAKRVNSRNPGEPVVVGDRIGYVIINGSEMLSKRAETVDYVKEKNLVIDSGYYIDRQLLPPVERILASVGVERNELLGFGRQASIMDIMSGKKRVMKHEITVRKPSERPALDNWEGFCCEKCKKKFNRPTLTGLCECGGLIVFMSKTGINDKARL